MFGSDQEIGGQPQKRTVTENSWFATAYPFDCEVPGHEPDIRPPGVREIALITITFSLLALVA
jgi:hypothetical protein